MLQALSAIAAPIIGGLFQRKANEENKDQQREFAQMGIRWRVEDAKAAGLHPLYALGGSGATYSPSAQPLMTGQDVSQAMHRLSPDARQLQLAQLDAVKAGTAKDLALAAAADAEAAKTRSDMMASKPIPPVAESFPVGPDFTPRTVIDGQTVSLGGTRFQELGPPPAVPPRYLTSAEATPGFQKYNVPGLGEVILPAGSSMSEAVESLENPVIQAAVASANLIHYGPGKLQALRNWARSGGRDWWSNPVGSFIDWNWGPRTR